MSLLSAFRGETYRTSVRSSKSPAIALRTSRSMQIKNAARVFPEPVGAEISVVWPARIRGQPSNCGSVEVPNRVTNQSRTSGCAHARPVRESVDSGDAETASITLHPYYTVTQSRRLQALHRSWPLLFSETRARIRDSPGNRAILFRIPATRALGK